MSKHSFRQRVNGQRYEVEIGWDEDAQCYYGMIYGWVAYSFPPGFGLYDELIWTSLGDENVVTLCTIVKECQARGFTIPDGFIEQVQSDHLFDCLTNTDQDDECALDDQEYLS